MNQQRVEDISLEQFGRPMEMNVFGYFYMVQAALPHLKAGDVIIKTGSIIGKIGKGLLIDYATSEGAVHFFTKSLALSLAERDIRVISWCLVLCGPQTFPPQCRRKRWVVTIRMWQ
jgi:NAD(P)-dependent dehydrogenase (short-subunit alcohol dehydrogenase family)